MQDVFAGTEITLSFAEEDRPGYFAIINADMELAELGWTTFPKLMHLGWAAQWLEYEGRLKANLSRPALVVPIFREAVSLQPALALLTPPIVATCQTCHASAICTPPLLSGCGKGRWAAHLQGHCGHPAPPPSASMPFILRWSAQPQQYGIADMC